MSDLPAVAFRAPADVQSAHAAAVAGVRSGHSKPSSDEEPPESPFLHFHVGFHQFSLELVRS